MSARRTTDPLTRKAIREARSLIQDAEKNDANEAETRRRIERIFEFVMGYDPFRHLSRERAIRGSGETEHVDFAVELERDGEKHPVIMIEIKRVNVDLAPKHLRQVSSYAINAGCEWIILTNGREWRLYHVSFGQPPVTKHIYSWNLLSDEVPLLAERFALVSYKSVSRGALDDLWQKTNVLLPRNLLEALLNPESLAGIRRSLRRSTGVLVSPEEIVGGIRRLLNESALAEMENIHISLPPRKPRRKRRSRDVAETHQEAEEGSSPEPRGRRPGTSVGQDAQESPPSSHEADPTDTPGSCGPLIGS